MRKAIVLIAVTLLICLGIGKQSNAQTWTDSFQVKGAYSGGAWESSYSFSYVLAPSVVLYSSASYGYDTWWVNEDYIKDVHGAPSGYTTKGRVTNSNGSAMETSFIPSLYSSGKADVKHTGEPVTFTGFLRNN